MRSRNSGEVVVEGMAIASMSAVVVIGVWEEGKVGPKIIMIHIHIKPNDQANAVAFCAQLLLFDTKILFHEQMNALLCVYILSHPPPGNSN